MVRGPPPLTVRRAAAVETRSHTAGISCTLAGSVAIILSNFSFFLVRGADKGKGLFMCRIIEEEENHVSTRSKGRHGTRRVNQNHLHPSWLACTSTCLSAKIEIGLGDLVESTVTGYIITYPLVGTYLFYM